MNLKSVMSTKKLKFLPLLDDFTNFYDKNNLKNISIEDLLGRKSIKGDPKLLDKNIKKVSTPLILFSIKYLRKINLGL